MNRSSSGQAALRTAIDVPESHFVLGNTLTPPFPALLETAVFGMGCFWGAERRFWELDGVYSTAAGYAGGGLEHPSYRDVCDTETGHAEVVLVVFDPKVVSYPSLLKIFWESHNPTQGFRQGNDIGSQYRSVIFATTDEQLALAKTSLGNYEQQLELAGHDRITTEIAMVPEFFYAEDYHQQYLAKNPGGYCGLGGTGVSCAISDENQ